MNPRTEAEIRQLLREDPEYREDLDFIHDTIRDAEVFIGQSEVEGVTGSRKKIALCVTVGMYRNAMPELVFCGIPVVFADAVVNALRDDEITADAFLAGKQMLNIRGFDTMAIPVQPSLAVKELEICRDYYVLHGVKRLDVVQVVFADAAGRFPWYAGYPEADRLRQPLVGQSVYHGAGPKPVLSH